MKARFSTLDIISILEELQQYVGMRVNQVYDIDNKTYLIKLQQPDKKVVLLIESGTRLHTTEFDWPKNPAPSGFSMKLRKHINNKRLESIKQVGVDRVVDIQFGSGEAAYHLILEMYDRGNLVLTDHEYKILNILRPRVAGEEKFLVRETYPLDLCKTELPTVDAEKLHEFLSNAKENDTLKKVLMPHFEFGSHLLEHLLLRVGISLSTKIKDFNMNDVTTLSESLNSASDFLKTEVKCGIIVQKVEKIPSAEEGQEKEFSTYIEFHPYLFQQYQDRSILKFDDFKTACDQFFSQIESQKIEMKTVQQEKAALKKLDNVKKDHENRIKSLQELQAIDRRKAELIEMNCEIVNNGIKVINSAIANQIPWDQIKEIIKEATEKGDPVASKIKQLKFDVNHIVMLLTDPYAHLDQEYEEEMEDEERVETEHANELMIEIDLNITAQANARKYFVQKKTAAVKEKKTVEAGGVALKSAEKKTKQQLKEMSKIATINKARKVFWFEKFFWFISSENYLVIGGKDAQQNELLVKRYMKPNDLYVHADLHGAATVIVKNPGTSQVPPKTLTEAGQFAVCFSAAWDSKVMTAAYWVKPDQVSKTAPSGEYLTVGSFMVRGKKNFLPPATLIMGFGFLFKLEDSSIERHRGERKVRGLEEESIASDVQSVTDVMEDVEINIEEGDSDDESEQVEEETIVKLEAIEEQLETSALTEKEEETPEPEAVSVKDKTPVSDNESSSDNEQKDEIDDVVSEFPDTDVKIGLDRLGSVEIKVRSENEDSKKIEGVVDKGNNKKVKGKFSNTQGTRDKNRGQNDKVEEAKKSENVRGKKGKMKKIKEKYKDQDDEERELRMQLLQSQGKGKENKNKKQNKKGLEQLYGKPKEKRPPPKPRAENPDHQNQNEEEKVTVNDETDMLDSLTGIPHEEDELLFVVPVCAPYSNLTNYKYKVKLTPGTGKRGKACKTALAMFLAEKSITNHEKDLLKSVKDQDLARNLPGKVKLSAPNLQRVKGKK